MKFFLYFFLLIFSVSIYAKESININEKLNQVTSKNKSLMFYFHIPDCPYCEKMINQNFKDEKILKLIKENFILVDIYTADKKNIVFKDFEGTPKEFAKYTGAIAYPATLFMNNDGKVFYKAIGYRNIQEYIYELKYVITKSYKKIPLDEFIFKMEIEDDN